LRCGDGDYAIQVTFRWDGCVLFYEQPSHMCNFYLYMKQLQHAQLIANTYFEQYDAPYFDGDPVGDEFVVAQRGKARDKAKELYQEYLREHDEHMQQIYERNEANGCNCGIIEDNNSKNMPIVVFDAMIPFTEDDFEHMQKYFKEKNK
jgi:hypothetical protein